MWTASLRSLTFTFRALHRLHPPLDFVWGRWARALPCVSFMYTHLSKLTKLTLRREEEWLLYNISFPPIEIGKTNPFGGVLLDLYGIWDL